MCFSHGVDWCCCHRAVICEASAVQTPSALKRRVAQESDAWDLDGISEVLWDCAPKSAFEHGYEEVSSTAQNWRTAREYVSELADERKHSDFQLNLRPPGKVFLLMCFVACFLWGTCSLQKRAHVTQQRRLPGWLGSSMNTVRSIELTGSMSTSITIGSCGLVCEPRRDGCP